MRGFVLSCFVSCAVLAPSVGTAQVYSRATPPPIVSAANAEWQINGEPIFHAGNFYFPTGPSIFFDGNVMVRTGMYQGVPLYADTTIEPYSVVYVPVGGNVMRPYERIRAGELAGSTGSRISTYPVRPVGERYEPADIVGSVMPDSMRDAARPVGTGGTIVNRAPAPVPAPTVGGRNRLTVETIPRPGRNEGVWVNFNGARWYHAGRPVSFNADRFEPVGSYRGFAVYKEKSGTDSTIYVSVVQDGPLTPYTRR